MMRLPRFFCLSLVLMFLMTWMTTDDIVAKTSLEVDSKTKEEVVNTVAEFMEDYYVFSKVGKEMGEHIKQKHSHGEYDGYTDVKAFCSEVTADLREISHDKHIFVFYSPQEAREVAARKGLLPDEEIKKINKMYYEMDRRANFGFSKVEILDGNIGYMKLNWFSGSDDACEVASTAMRFLACTDAIIIDLRNNGGGGGSVGGLLASYFFGPEKMPLTGAYRRSTNTIERRWTMSDVPGEKRPDVDVYILTNSRTFSAAEDFSYSLKHLKRATIVGEATKGGAHPVDVMIVEGDILTQISIANSINPITNSNWEDTGVLPHIEVSSEKALHTAHLLAVRSLLKKTVNDELQQELQDVISRLEKSGNSMTEGR